VQLDAAGSDDLLLHLVKLAAPDSPHHEVLCDEVRAREAIFPTALGDGVALPHVRTACVPHVHVSAAVLATPLAFGSADSSAVDVFFLVLSPAHAPSDHLNVLRAIARLVADANSVAALRRASTAGEFLAILRQSLPL